MAALDKVLTLCASCRKEITVKASYADRNKKFKCNDCK
jgi:predicted RNA-binding Zn-ribbon protein involved in translation (DUF1610 family)